MTTKYFFTILLSILSLSTYTVAQENSDEKDYRLLKEEFPVLKIGLGFLGDINKSQEISIAGEAFLEITDHNRFQFFTSTSSTASKTAYNINMTSTNEIRRQAFNDFIFTIYPFYPEISENQHRVKRIGLSFGLVTRNGTVSNIKYGDVHSWRTPEGILIPAGTDYIENGTSPDSRRIYYGTTYQLRFLRIGAQATIYNRVSNMETTLYIHSLIKVAGTLDPIRFSSPIEYIFENFPGVLPAGEYDLETDPNNKLGGICLSGKRINFSAGVRTCIMSKKKNAGFFYKLEGGLMDAYTSNTYRGFDTKLPLYFNFRIGIVFGSNGMSALKEKNEE